MKRSKLSIQMCGALFIATLVTSCHDNDQLKSKGENTEQEETQHGKHSHGHGFGDKKAVEEMAKNLNPPKEILCSSLKRYCRI